MTFENSCISGGYNHYFALQEGVIRTFQAIAKSIKISEGCREVSIVLFCYLM